MIESDDKANFDTFYRHTKDETITNESGIYDAFESIYTAIISNIKGFRKTFWLHY